MCKVLGISRSSYYKRRSKGKSAREEENEKILKMINEIFTESRESYGSPRITEELRKRGLVCNKKRIAGIMRKNGIVAKIYRKYRSTTQSDHQREIAENILGREFLRKGPNEVWTSDITYIRTSEGWLYLVVIMDVYSRKIIGWELDKTLRSEMVERAMKKALMERKVMQEGIIFHSDQGIQYTSESFRELLRENGFIQSMSRRGNCYDNAVTETFFHTLKTELVNRRRYKSREEARRSIFEYIEIFYNRKRIHSAIDYLSPVEFEKLT
jgi:transposase InsO family protein